MLITHEHKPAATDEMLVSFSTVNVSSARIGLQAEKFFGLT